MSNTHSVFARDFSKSVKSALLRKGVRIIGKQAIPASPDDKYFTGTAYVLVTANGQSMLREYHQVICMAKSSWMPD